MGAAERELFELLKQYDFELIRGKKHKVYKNCQGQTSVLSSTPSDEGWAENALHNLKNCLGIGSQGKEAVVGDRRQKRNRPEKQRPVSFSLMGPRSFARKPTLQDRTCDDHSDVVQRSASGCPRSEPTIRRGE